MGDWIRPDWPAPTNIIAGTTLRIAAANALPVKGKPCWLSQVHGSDVVQAAHYETPPAADASVSGATGYLSVVRTADCLPLLMCSRDGRVFGAAHAGWRGLAAGVIENTIANMDVAAKDLLVWLGPAISQPSFEVGGEVRDAFIASDPNASTCFLANERGRWQADLYGLARQRLRSSGVKDVYGGGMCTFLDRERFYSYRRNPNCGRMLSFIGHITPITP